MTVAHERTGLFFILVGPAGAGKNRLMNIALDRIDDLSQLPTATTRAIRDGEQQGREHLFLTRDDFLKMITDDQLLEWQEVHGNLYGMPRATVEEALQAGRAVIADIEVLGASYVRSLYPENVITIFIQPPSLQTLIERMRTRGDSEAEISKRLLRVAMEMDYAAECDYVIVNDDLEQAAETLCAIITAEHNRRAVPHGTFNYRYMARAVPICADAVLCHDEPPHFPIATLDPEELPHDGALRALSAALHLPVTPNNLIAGGQADGRFTPPVIFDCDEISGCEVIKFLYLYRLETHIPAPEGWSWLPLTQAVEDYDALPSAVLDVVAAAVAESGD
ncbi:MAG: guanylate kinase [Chloroflexi bacterium]|nr:guanylate kinase [Chloroflexota bacterium]